MWKRMQCSLNYSGTRFSPLKIKITQFPSGFRLKFSTPHFICVLNVLLFSFWIDWLWTKEPQFRGLYLKSRQMRWCTYISTYIVIHPKISNKAGFRHRQPRLITYATWVSLLQSLVASQHYWMRLGIMGRIMEIERCVISCGRLAEADNTLWDLQHLLWYFPWLVFLYPYTFNLHMFRLFVLNICVK